MMKIRILQPSDWAFHELDKFILNGGEASSVSRFGYEYLKQKKIKITVVTPGNSKLCKALTKLLGSEGRNIILQLKCLLHQKDVDIIYYATDRHPYMLAILRWLRICRTPILLVSHFSYNTQYVESKLKRIVLKVERFFVYRGIDQIIFSGENILKGAMQDAKVPKRHQISGGWGADIKYFSNGITHKITFPYYFGAGSANRDYITLVKAFKQMPYHLILSCPQKLVSSEMPLPSNITFYNYKSAGLNAYVHLRDLYKQAKATLIPIYKSNHVPNGASVLVEALAAGCPVIVTDLPSNYIDVEKEGVGIKVKLRDVNDWILKIKELEHSQELKKMANNALQLARYKYNYEDFANIVYNEMIKLSDTH